MMNATTAVAVTPEMMRPIGQAVIVVSPREHNAGCACTDTNLIWLIRPYNVREILADRGFLPAPFKAVHIGFLFHGGWRHASIRQPPALSLRNYLSSLRRVGTYTATQSLTPASRIRKNSYFCLPLGVSSSLRTMKSPRNALRMLFRIRPPTRTR